jgi:hypothetical protein
MRALDTCRSGFVSRRFLNIRVTDLAEARGRFLEPTPWASLAEGSVRLGTRSRPFWLRNCPPIFLGNGINPNPECHSLTMRRTCSVLWMAISVTQGYFGTVTREVISHCNTTRLPDTLTNGAETNGSELAAPRGTGRSDSQRAPFLFQIWCTGALITIGRLRELELQETTINCSIRPGFGSELRFDQKRR